MEAADDISYRVIDIEDGFRLGYLSLPQVEDLYRALIASPGQLDRRLSRIGDGKGRVEFLRAKVINEAINQSMACFLDNEEAILGGHQIQPLMELLPKREAMDRLIEVARERIYCAPEVVEVQAAGFQVIWDLLERFIQALDDLSEHGEAAPRSRMLAYLVPSQFKSGRGERAQGFYPRLLSLTDFVSGMTDSYAVSLYKKITGISLPGK